MTINSTKDFFRDLPDEILEKIFLYLSSKEEVASCDEERSVSSDIKRATLVCQRWNEVISVSLKIMSRFVLQITELSLEDLEYLEIRRRYQKCELFKVPNECLPQCMNIIQNFGHEIKILTFHGTYPEMATSLLNLCKNIEHVKLYNVTSQRKFTTIRNATSKNFPKLKSLSIVNRAQIVSFKDAENIAKISEFIDDTSQILNSFSQFEIEDLVLYSRSSILFPKINNWKLRKLEVGKVVNIASLVQFLKDQKPYLRELSVHFHSSILEFIMLELTDLKILKLSIDHLPENPVCNNFIEPNSELKELTIIYSQLHMRNDFMQTIFRHYTNINSLEMNFNYGGWAFTDGVLNLQLESVTHLRINKNSNYVFQCGKFPNLKSLEVDYFRGSMLYNLNCINTLEKLVINITSFNMSTLANFYPNLKYLSVKDGLDLDEKEMTMIIERLPKLETFIIKRYMWQINANPQDFLASINNCKLIVIFENS